MPEERLHPTVQPLDGHFGCALTVDVEEWYHSCLVPDYVDPARRPPLAEELDWLLPELLGDLAAAGRKATFFVLGELAERRPALVREVAAAGHEIGSHGRLHLRAGWLSLASFREDVRRSKLALEDLLGQPILGFRAPEWSLRSAANPRLRVVAELGFGYDSSLNPCWGPGARGNPRSASRITWGDGLELLEFPPLTYAGALRLPAGGWTGRLLPPGVLVRAAERHHLAGGLPVAVVHPWELSDQATPGEFSGLARFVHETGRRRFRPKFRALCEAHPWESVRSAANLNGASARAAG